MSKMKLLFILVVFLSLEYAAPPPTRHLLPIKGRFQVIAISQENCTLDLFINQEHHIVTLANGTERRTVFGLTDKPFANLMVKLNGTNTRKGLRLGALSEQANYNIMLDDVSVRLKVKFLCASRRNGDWCKGWNQTIMAQNYFGTEIVTVPTPIVFARNEEGTPIIIKPVIDSTTKLKEERFLTESRGYDETGSKVSSFEIVKFEAKQDYPFNMMESNALTSYVADESPGLLYYIGIVIIYILLAPFAIGLLLLVLIFVSIIVVAFLIFAIFVVMVYFCGPRDLETMANNQPEQHEMLAITLPEQRETVENNQPEQLESIENVQAERRKRELQNFERRHLVIRELEDHGNAPFGVCSSEWGKIQKKELREILIARVLDMDDKEYGRLCKLMEKRDGSFKV